MNVLSDRQTTIVRRYETATHDHSRRESSRPVAEAALECSNRLLAPELIELVDALVAAVDLERSWEIERLSTALESYGASWMFADELRLNGTPSPSGCICDGEGWL